jgi:hypothetical protein
MGILNHLVWVAILAVVTLLAAAAGVNGEEPWMFKLKEKLA